MSVQQGVPLAMSPNDAAPSPDQCANGRCGQRLARLERQVEELTRDNQRLQAQVRRDFEDELRVRAANADISLDEVKTFDHFRARLVRSADEAVSKRVHLDSPSKTTAQQTAGATDSSNCCGAITAVRSSGSSNLTSPSPSQQHQQAQQASQYHHSLASHPAGLYMGNYPTTATSANGAIPRSTVDVPLTFLVPPTAHLHHHHHHHLQQQQQQQLASHPQGLPWMISGGAMGGPPALFGQTFATAGAPAATLIGTNATTAPAAGAAHTSVTAYPPGMIPQQQQQPPTVAFSGSYQLPRHQQQQQQQQLLSEHSHHHHATSVPLMAVPPGGAHALHHALQALQAPTSAAAMPLAMSAHGALQQQQQHALSGATTRTPVLRMNPQMVHHPSAQGVVSHPGDNSWRTCVFAPALTSGASVTVDIVHLEPLSRLCIGVVTSNQLDRVIRDNTFVGTVGIGTRNDYARCNRKDIRPLNGASFPGVGTAPTRVKISVDFNTQQLVISTSGTSLGNPTSSVAAFEYAPGSPVLSASDVFVAVSLQSGGIVRLLE